MSSSRGLKRSNGNVRSKCNKAVEFNCINKYNRSYINFDKDKNKSRYHRIIHPNMYAKVKALAKAEGISDEEAYDRIMYEAAHYKTV